MVPWVDRAIFGPFFPLSPLKRTNRPNDHGSTRRIPRTNLWGLGDLALPTLADEWAVVVNEAMTSGMPVLGSLYSQAVEEIVEDGVSGRTFRPDRPDEMYSGIDRALATAAESLQEMRARARQRAMASTPRFAAEKIQQAIELAIQRKRYVEGERSLK